MTREKSVLDWLKRQSRSRSWWEIVIVLMVSLGFGRRVLTGGDQPGSLDFYWDMFLLAAAVFLGVLLVVKATDAARRRRPRKQ